MAAPVPAPPWLARLVLPFAARHVARELSLYRGEFRRVQLSQLMARPYVRVVVLHIAIILGGIGAMALGSPLWALLLLVGLKIGLDLKAHLKEHSS